MNEKRKRIVSAAVTALVMVALTALLLLCGLKSILPRSEEGLSVNFGNVDLSSGEFEPYAPQPTASTEVPQPQVNSTPQTAPEELITSNEESIDLDARKAEEEEQARKAEEERLRQERQQQQAKDIENLAQNAFGTPKGTDSQQQGNDQEAQGNQGRADGNPENPEQGLKDFGYGSFDLGGRGLEGGLPRPQYDVNAAGTVRVSITVNPEGQVVDAQVDILKDTNTEDERLRQAALKAARQTRFTPIPGKDNQHGYIVYRFILK